MTTTTREKFEKEFLQSSHCNDRECMYSGNSRCFHGIGDDVIVFIETIEKEAEERGIQQGREEVKARVQLFVDKRYGPSGNGFEIGYNHAVDLIANSISSLK